MNKRLETFCDGIFAIAITLLILEIKVPSIVSIHSSADLKHRLLFDWPSWFAFLLSFISMFIAWVNHHHFMKQISPEKTSNSFMYAHGLFVLTLIVYPFTTSLLAEYLNTPYLKFPVFIYCLMNTVHAASWVLICHSALRPVNLGENEAKTKYIAGLRKNISFTVIFNIAMCALAFWFPIIAVSLTALAWLIYLIMGITLSPINN
jgi:uncharacterized membrane protein